MKGNNPITTLQHIEFRASYLLFIGLGIQIALAYYTAATGESLPYVLEAAFIVLVLSLMINRGKPGIKLVLAGCSLNLAALLFNGGKMPVSYKALQIADLEHLSDYSSASRHQHMDSQHIQWLGDWIPFFTPIGTNYVLSPGDLVIGAGLIIYIVRITKWRVTVI
ncbi:DUF5317 domain-containing protein [Paenibacillus tarimensis]|uniref:DUF5317 domain-containing protein n=1 Tax=Paenibacillus tarimensis TaxID=416012 RepID=UPI0039F06C42